MLAPMALTPPMLYVQEWTARAGSHTLGLIAAAAAGALMAGAVAVFDRMRRRRPAQAG